MVGLFFLGEDKRLDINDQKTDACPPLDVLDVTFYFLGVQEEFFLGDASGNIGNALLPEVF